MSHGRYYIAPLRVTSTVSTSNNSEVHKRPPRKEVKPSKPIKIDLSNSQNKIRDHIYYAALSKFGAGYGAAAQAWCGHNYRHVGIND